MIVLHELNCLELGGAERVVLNLATHDKAREHIVFAWKDGPMREELERAGVRLVVRDLRPVPEPDVVHVHTGGHESRLAILAENKVPVVETIHAPVRTAVFVRHVTRRVAVSAAVAAVNPGAIVIHNGVDFRRLLPIATKAEARAGLGLFGDRAPENALVIGWLGRIVPDKHLEGFLDVVAEVNRVETAAAVIVGPDTGDAAAYVAELHAYAAKLRVTLTTPGPRNPGRAIPAFDVFLSCSLVEAHPLVLAEAMVLHVPVAAMDEPATREFTLNGTHAALACPPQRETAAAAVLAAKWRTPQQLVDACLYASRFRVETMVAQYGEVYAAAVAEWRSR